MGLSAEGVRQAVHAGQLLRQRGYLFDAGFTSVLKRVLKTLDFVLEEVAALDIPTGLPLVYELDGQLNRLRHYYLE